MLHGLKPHHIMWILFLFAMVLIAIGIANAENPLRDGVGDVVDVPEGWKPFVYNPKIPLSESLQCILWDSCIEFKVPEYYALAIIQTESGFNINANSGVSHGLMQLHEAYYDPNMPPGENIIEGVKLLSEKYNQYGNWPAAITAYTVGHDDGSRWYYHKIESRSNYWWGVLNN